MDSTVEIDYDQVKMVALNSTEDPELNHDFFMSTYPSMFIPRMRLEPGIPNRPTKSFLQSHPFYGQKPRSRHGVQRSRPTTADPFAKPENDGAAASTASSTSKELLHRAELVSELHQIIIKFPFERTRKEHKRVFELFAELAPDELISCAGDDNQNKLLRHVLHAATHIVYPDTGMTVFGNSGLFMILKGTVRPQTIPYLNITNVSTDEENHLHPAHTPILRRRNIKLSVGDCFGTFERIPGKESNSKIFSVITREPCEVLKISCNDFKRIVTRLRDEEKSEKTTVIQACKSYKNWPNLSVKAIASCVVWQHFPENTIILNEGEVSPFIGFIKSGRCEVFKSVDAVKTLPDNRKVKMHKQVCMGILTAGDSVGETSMLMQELLTCSVIATSDVMMAIIKQERLQGRELLTRWKILNFGFRCFLLVHINTETDAESERIAVKNNRLGARCVPLQQLIIIHYMPEYLSFKVLLKAFYSFRFVSLFSPRVLS